MKQEEVNKKQKKKNSCADFPCYYPLYKQFDGWYEFTKTSHIRNGLGMICREDKTGRFNSDVALKQHCTNVESWYHKMVQYLATELFEVKPDSYEEHIVPDIDAAWRDRVDDRVNISAENRDISVNESSNESIYSDNDMKTHNVVG